MVLATPAWGDPSQELATLQERLESLRVGDVAPAEEPGAFARFYLHALRQAADSELIAHGMPEVWQPESFLYRSLYRHNAPRLEGILRGALGRAAVEELLGTRGPEELVAPITPVEDIERRMRPGLDLRFSVQLSGVGVSASYSFGEVVVGAGYSTATGRVDAVRLSHPFASGEDRGEVGVDSRGRVWVYFLGRW